MNSFNVINFDFNRSKFVKYDVMPYLVRAYEECVEKSKEHPDSDYWKVPKTFEECRDFIKDRAQYQFWSRCEYEIILVDWPCQKHEEKWDVYDQIMMNLDIVTDIFINNIKSLNVEKE